MNTCLCALFLATTATVASFAASLRLANPPTFGGVTALAFSPNGATVAGGLGKVSYTSNNIVVRVEGGGVVLWDPTAGGLRSQLGPTGETVDGVAWTPEGQWLVAVNSELGRVHLLDPNAGQTVRTLVSPDGQLFRDPRRQNPTFALSPDGRRIAVSGARAEIVGTQTVRSAGTLSVWDLATGQLLWSQPAAGAEAITFARGGASVVAFTRQTEWSVDGNGAAVGKVVSQALEAWNAEDGIRSFQVPMEGTNVGHLVAAPDGLEVLALAGQKSGWHDPLTGRRTRPQPFPITATLGRVELDRSGDRLLVTEWNGQRIHLFQFSTGSALALQTFSLSEAPQQTAVSPDFTRLATSRLNLARLLDLPTPRIVSFSESAEGAEFIVEAPVGTYSELRFRTDLDSLWTVADAVLTTTNRFVLRDTNPAHRAAPAGFWQVYFQ